MDGKNIVDAAQGAAEGALAVGAGVAGIGVLVVGVTAYIQALSGETVEPEQVRTIIENAFKMGSVMGSISGGTVGAVKGEYIGFLDPVRKFIEETYGKVGEKLSNVKSRFSGKKEEKNKGNEQ